MKLDPDKKLVRACQAHPPTGLEGAFRELYDQYKDRVYNVCFRITGNSSDALDAAQGRDGQLCRLVAQLASPSSRPVMRMPALGTLYRRFIQISTDVSASDAAALASGPA